MAKKKKDYDLAKAFERIEDELISSMMKNLEHHKAEETKEGILWEQWQAKQLYELEQYRKRNASRFGSIFERLNQQIGNLLKQMNGDGMLSQERAILRAIKKGAQLQKASKGMTGEFFKINDRKLNALIEATTNDMQKAETAILRMSNDQYRKIIYDAQVYANSGAGTYEKAVDMATKDFMAAGLTCVEYKNGARHTLSDYADMAIRTASKRAYLQGEGTKRQEWGIHTVIVNKRSDRGPGGVCPKCLPFVGKVFIDDVWSGGQASDGPYPLISTAIDAGLYHPRCRDSHTTYFPGISGPADDTFTKKELKDIEETEKETAKQQHAELQAKKWQRVAETRLDPEEKEKYEKLTGLWATKAVDTQGLVNKANRIKTIDDLKRISKSSIIDMETIEEIRNYFSSTHAIDIKGFDKKDIFDVKAVLAGYDDTLNEFKRLAPRIHTIEYNFHLKVYGKMAETGRSLVGPAGLRDYGTGVHETTHAIDFAMSMPNTHSFAEDIIEKARKNLKLKKNSKDYLDLRVKMCGGLTDIDTDCELLAYGIETAKAGPDNILAKEIYRLLKEK